MDVFSDLYQKHAEFALRTAKAITRSEDLAADATQESFIRVYRNLKSFDPDKPFKPWFYTILVNECNRLLKARSKTAYLNDISSIDVGRPDLVPFQEYEDLYKAIDSLGQETRVVIILKYLNDFSEKEIATVLGLNLNTVKSRLYKGRQKLKQAMEDFHTMGGYQ